MVAPSLGRTRDGLGPWQVELVARPAVAGLATVGIWRVRGADWTIIVKVLRHADGEATSAWQSEKDPRHPFYWRREADAFESDLLASLPEIGGLRAPASHGVVDRPDGTVAVWMEDVAGNSGSDWDLRRYHLAARHLGQLQGRLADAGALDQPWLSRGWLPTYLERRVRWCGPLDDPDAWGHPLVQKVLPTGRAGEFRALWADRERFQAVLDSFPRTLCELDLHPRNLFDVAGDTVVIDWAFAGVGALGEDPGNLVVDAVTDFHLAPDLLPVLFDVLVDGYAAGLADSGHLLPIDNVRRAVAAGAAAKFGWLVPAILSTATNGRPTLNGRPVEEGMASWGAVGVFLLDLKQIASGQ